MRDRRPSAFSRIARGTARRSPDQVAVRSAIQSIISLPEWPVLLDYLEHVEKRHTAAADQSGDNGALLRSAGRRSLLRELEVLDERVTDDDRGEQSG